MGSGIVTRRRTGPVAWVLVLPIRFYQRFITPYTPATCRYYPTCSAYAVDALRGHGAIKGLLLTAWRLLRCNPWSSGGVDYVPQRGQWRSTPPVYDDDAGCLATHDDARGSAFNVAPAASDDTATPSDPAAYSVDAAPTARRTAA